MKRYFGPYEPAAAFLAMETTSGCPKASTLAGFFQAGAFFARLEMTTSASSLLQRQSGLKGSKMSSHPSRQSLSRTIALVLPPTVGSRDSDPFFHALVSGITEHAATYGFALLLSHGGNSADDVSQQLEEKTRRRADGIIVVRVSPNDERIRRLQAEHFPFVAFGRTLDGNEFPCVDIDNEHGMSLLVDHLVGFGHTRIAALVEPPLTSKAIQRRSGFEAALAARELYPETIVDVEHSREDGFQKTLQLLRKKNRPTAIVCGTDLIAVGACAAAADVNLVVGRDVSITGFDNAFGDTICPRLTTINNPAYEIGHLICSRLVQIVLGETPTPEQVVLRPELIVRETTGPVIG